MLRNIVICDHYYGKDSGIVKCVLWVARIKEGELGEIIVIDVCIITAKYLVDRTWILRDKEILESLGFRVRILGVDSDIISLSSVKNIKSYIVSLRNCDVVFGWFALPSTILLSKIMGIPIIANAIGYEVAYYPEILYGLPQNLAVRPIIALALRIADEIIAASKESLRWAYKWSGRKGFVIYFGIDFEKYDCSGVVKNTVTEGPIITIISYLGLGNVIRKDIPTLIKAICEVKRKYPNLK